MRPWPFDLISKAIRCGNIELLLDGFFQVEFTKIHTIFTAHNLSAKIENDEISHDLGMCGNERNIALFRAKGGFFLSEIFLFRGYIAGGHIATVKKLFANRPQWWEKYHYFGLVAATYGQVELIEYFRTKGLFKVGPSLLFQSVRKPKYTPLLIQYCESQGVNIENILPVVFKEFIQTAKLEAVVYLDSKYNAVITVLPSDVLFVSHSRWIFLHSIGWRSFKLMKYLMERRPDAFSSSIENFEDTLRHEVTRNPVERRPEKERSAFYEFSAFLEDFKMKRAKKEVDKA